MFKKVKVNKLEFLLKTVQTEQKNIKHRMEFISNRNKLLSENLRKIFTIWNNFFKGVAVVVSIGITTAITAVTRVLYIDDGYKWSFSTVFIGGIVYLVVTGLLIWGSWALINTLLTEKIDNIFLRTSENEEREEELT